MRATPRSPTRWVLVLGGWSSLCLRPLVEAAAQVKAALFCDRCSRSSSVNMCGPAHRSAAHTHALCAALLAWPPVFGPVVGEASSTLRCTFEPINLALFCMLTNTAPALLCCPGAGRCWHAAAVCLVDAPADQPLPCVCGSLLSTGAGGCGHGAARPFNLPPHPAPREAERTGRVGLLAWGVAFGCGLCETLHFPPHPAPREAQSGLGVQLCLVEMLGCAHHVLAMQCNV